MYLTQDQKEFNAQVANRVAVANAHRHIEMAARRLANLNAEKQRKMIVARMKQTQTTQA